MARPPCRKYAPWAPGSAIRFPLRVHGEGRGAGSAGRPDARGWISADMPEMPCWPE